MNEILNARLKQYIAAETAILTGGQSYKIGNRTLTRADLVEIQSVISKLLSAGATIDDVPRTGSRSRQVVLRD
jgi:hypothetical protein